MTSPRPQRTLTLVDDTVTVHLPISSVVEVDIPKKQFYVEERADGSVRLTISKAFGLATLTPLKQVTVIFRRPADEDETPAPPVP